jgi:hypothetical protein
MLVVYELVQLVVVVKKGWLGEWFHAFRWILRHWSSTLHKRRRIQSSRRTLDRELLAGGPIPFRGELATDRLEQIGRRWLDAAANWYWKRVAHFI